MDPEEDLPRKEPVEAYTFKKVVRQPIKAAARALLKSLGTNSVLVYILIIVNIEYESSNTLCL